MNRLAELERKLENLLRPGTVEEVSGTRCRVKSGDILTGWLPWFTQRAGDDADWWPLEKGEQVMVLSPGGDLALGFVLAGLYSQARPAPSTDAGVRTIRFADGTTLIYDRNTHKLSAYVKGDVEIFCDGGLVADVGTNASVTAEGSVSAVAGASLTAQAQSAEVTAANITLNGAVQVNGPLMLAGPLTAVPGAAGGGASLQGDFAIVGNLDTQGSLTNNGKNVGSDLRVSGITPGGGVSGNPV